METNNGVLRANGSIIIRKESTADYRKVEENTRNAFYNLYVPGCDEHYLAHILRQHEDFLEELSFVLEVDGQLIGNIMYTKARLVDEAGTEKEILTFGPISVLPAYQRMGYGKMLMEHSFAKAITLGYDTVVIFGSPSNYVSRGFKSCKRFRVCLEDGTYPTAMLVKELKPEALDGRRWVYHGSPAMQVDEQAAKRFDESFEKREKQCKPSQEEFYILSGSTQQ